MMNYCALEKSRLGSQSYWSFFISFLLIVLIIFFGLLLAGCSGPEQDAQKQFQEKKGVVPASTGLELSLIDGAPPDVVQDKAMVPFSFMMAVENMGEADVGPGTDNPLVFARLSGIMHKNFGITEQEAVKVLDSSLTSSKRNFDGSITPGEINYLGFEELVYEPDVFESFAITMRGELCYDYTTESTIKFCMKRDVLESWQDASICVLRGPKEVMNSGAPIQITRAEEAPVNSQTVQLNFVIEHVGNGLFFSRHDYDSLDEVCVFDEINPHIYKLEVLVRPLEKDAYEIECMGLDEQLPGGGAAGMVRLYQGAPVTISCFLKRTALSESRIYEDLLNVELRYRYADFIEKPVLIQGHP